MPELPEVETVKLGLEKKLLDFRIAKIEVLKDRTIASIGGVKQFTSMLSGTNVKSWGRRGKYIIAELEKSKDGGNFSEAAGWWIIHLRMTGHFQFYNDFQEPCKHTRVRFYDSKGRELRFVDIRNFGQMWWHSNESHPSVSNEGIKKLGPEPFSKKFNSSYLKQKLTGKTRSIKSALLDQTIVAGTGNIYADESLFKAGILPTRASGNIKNFELEKLCNSLKKILRISIGKGGTTFSDFRDIEGLNGNYGEEAYVYKRDKKPCKTCGSKILKTKICGRGTHWCPSCQR